MNTRQQTWGSLGPKENSPLKPFMPDSLAPYCVKINLTPTHLSEGKVSVHTQHHITITARVRHSTFNETGA